MTADIDSCPFVSTEVSVHLRRVSLLAYRKNEFKWKWLTNLNLFYNWNNAMNHDAHILYVFDVVVDDKTMIKSY